MLGDDIAQTVSRRVESPGAREVRVTLVREAFLRRRFVRVDGTPADVYELNDSVRKNPQGRFAWNFTCAGPLTLHLFDANAGLDSTHLRPTVTVQEERDLNVGTLVLLGCCREECRPHTR